MSVVQLVRPELAGMRPYAAAEQVTDTIRLNANEAPWHNETDIFQRPLNRYPEIRPASLRRRLADRFGCAPRQLLVTRGSSEAIDLLVRVFCEAGRDNIVIATPTFSMYEHYARIQGAAVRALALDPDAGFTLDAHGVLCTCTEQTKLVFLCTPNNPTGTSIPQSTIRQILEQARGRFAVVVDEAYIEFSGQPSAAELLDEFDNLVVLRTLSKALAFAGARCGSVIANEALIDVIDAVQAPYALATPVVEYVESALQSEFLAAAQQHIDETVAERESLRAKLGTMASVRRIWDSDANFLLVEFDDADAVMNTARENGILLRHFGGSLEGCVRISVGSPKENMQLVEALRSMEVPA